MTDLIRAKDERLAAKFFEEHPDLEAVIRRYPEAADIEFDDPVKLGCYLHYREQGIDHQWSSMQACRRAGRMKGSDQGFNEHARHRMNTMSKEQMDLILKKAHAAGVKTQGKFYCGGLADRRGCRDPQAWVSTTADILEVCRRRNLDATGVVSHKAVDRPPLPKTGVAKDVVDDILRDRMKADPAVKAKLREGGKKALRQMREEIASKHARRK